MVTLINGFDLLEGHEDDFVAGWLKLSDELADAPGFRGACLYRGEQGVSEFAFVNIAEWDSAEAWRAAISRPGFQARLRDLNGASGHPGLYTPVCQVVRNDTKGAVDQRIPTTRWSCTTPGGERR